jgi:hypothetical protein
MTHAWWPSPTGTVRPFAAAEGTQTHGEGPWRWWFCCGVSTSAGTFVVRHPVPQAELRAELKRGMPFALDRTFGAPVATRNWNTMVHVATRYR